MMFGSLREATLLNGFDECLIFLNIHIHAVFATNSFVFVTKT